jgi:hypothetical protein
MREFLNELFGWLIVAVIIILIIGIILIAGGGMLSLDFWHLILSTK